MDHFYNDDDGSSASLLDGAVSRRLNETADDNALVTSNDSEIIRGTLRLYGSIFLGCLVIYELLLRKRYPRLFNIRSWVPEHKCKLAMQEYDMPFSWIWRVFRVTDEELLDNCNLDTVCFLRALKFGRKLTILGCFNAIWLIPLYRTAKPSEETAYLEDPFVLISISNLPSSSKRFLGTVFAAYIIFFYAMYIIFHEFEWYTKFRHKFLSAKEPRNYSVYVSGIPNEYQTSRKLQQYFERCCSKEAVLEAHIAVDTQKLQTKIARRDAVLRHLERLYYLESRSGKTETHRRVRLGRLNKGVEKVESVAVYEEELKELNQYVEEKVKEIRNSSSCEIELVGGGDDDVDGASDYFYSVPDDDSAHSKRYALGPEAWGGSRLTDALLDSVIPLEMKSEPHDLDDPNALDVQGVESAPAPSECSQQSDQEAVASKISSDDLESNTLEEKSDDVNGEKSSFSIRNSVVVAKAFGKGLDRARENISGNTRAATKSIAKGSKIAGDIAGDLIQKGGDIGAKTMTKTFKNAKSAGTNIITSAGAVVPILLSTDEGAPLNAGFVTFRDLYSTQTALQMIHHPKAYVMGVIPAPQPGAIFWRNVGLPPSARRGGRAAAIAASAVLCIFWSIPMTFISSLTELNSLKESLPKFGAWIDQRPAFERFLALTAPLILLFFNETLLPSILKYFATWEGHVSTALLEASLFVKLGCFMIIQTFFVSASKSGIALIGKPLLQESFC